MKTKKEAILLVLICTFFTSVGQLFLKIGSKNLSFNFIELLTNLPLIVGFSFYIIGAVILIFALKNGELSVIYPFIATSFVWVSFLSVIFLKEVMNILKWSGLFVIILGMAFIGKGGSLR
ncbi:MAG: EamA family transporter [Candidatus Nanoarchaeia archaeon]|nr:EamA family transporter [Candidatus Nanoarchaeia archaeon]